MTPTPTTAASDELVEHLAALIAELRDFVDANPGELVMLHRPRFNKIVGSIQKARARIEADAAEMERKDAAMREMIEAFDEVLSFLRKEAPGTPLNNHRFDNIGFRAYAAVSHARAALEPATATEQEGAHFDTCTEPECRRCRTPPYARGDMKHSGIGFYPTLDTPTPAPEPGSGEGLVERLRHRGQRWAAGQRGGDLDNEAATALTTLQQQLAARDALLKADNWAALAQERLNTIVALEERATAAEAERDQWKRDAGILLANIDYLEECTGEGPEDEDRALVEQIRAALRPEAKGGRE